MEQSLDFVGIGFRMLAANSLACDFAVIRICFLRTRPY